MKAQVAVEYMIIVGFAIMVLIPYILYLNDLTTNYSTEKRLALAKNCVDKLGETIDWVFSQGEGAKTKIELLIPDGTESIQFINKTIILKIRTSSGISDVSYTAVANITGSIPTYPGYKIVFVEAVKGGVNVSSN